MAIETYISIITLNRNGLNATTKITIPSKDLIQIWRRNQKLYRQQKLREFSTTKPAPQQMLKDLLYIGNTERVYKLKPKAIK